jgi:hypothetical protein
LGFDRVGYGQPPGLTDSRNPSGAETQILVLAGSDSAAAFLPRAHVYLNGVILHTNYLDGINRRMYDDAPIGLMVCMEWKMSTEHTHERHR